MKSNRRFSLGNPAPGHEPQVGRRVTGMTPYGASRPYYGTTLYCECHTDFGTVSNEAPSRGGRAEANHRYQIHLAVVGLTRMFVS